MSPADRRRGFVHQFRQSRGPRTRRPLLERLEDRLMLSGSPEAHEFIYLLNLARHNPARFAREFGLPVDLAQASASAPLAMSDAMSQAAATRVEEMAQNDYFQHQSTVTGKWPNQLAREAGYILPASWPDAANFIESIAAGSEYATGETLLQTLLVDAQEPSLIHRRQLLGLDAPFAENQAIGISHAFSSEATFGHYWAVETVPGDPAGAFLTGVVFDDANQDGRYDAGEGLAGVTITANNWTTTTDDAGGWSLLVPPGDYRVAASGPGFSQPAVANVRVEQDNVEVDFLAGRQRGTVNFLGWQNAVDRCDINGDGAMTPLDVLLIVNELNVGGARELSGSAVNAAESHRFWDVSGDDTVSALDVLHVINALNADPPTWPRLSETPNPVSNTSAS